MHFVRIESSDGETRWINLDQIVRVTLAEEAPSGEPLLVITSTHDDGERFSIRGHTEKDRRTIEKLIALLDDVANKP